MSFKVINDKITSDMPSDTGVIVINNLLGIWDAAAVGWTGKISGVTNPAKICGVAIANISKVMGVS